MDNEKSNQAMSREEKPLNELLSESMVNIYVGQENTHWYLHERLLCYYSPFFADIFYADDKDKSQEVRKAQKTKAYGLQDEEDLAFEMFVGWLYSRSIKVPKEEKDVGPLLDLYLLSDKLKVEKLNNELVEAVSDYYYQSHTYPSLRRVQHVYANTDSDNEMREMMVGAVAKLLTTSAKIPEHWASALQRNGQLAVDIIRSIQQWKLEEKTIPDARDRSSSRGRSIKNGFSAIERSGTDSMETEKTGGSNMGVESLNSDHDMQDSQMLKSEDSEAQSSFTTPPPNYSALSTPAPMISPYKMTWKQKWSPKNDSREFDHHKWLQYRPKRPPDVCRHNSMPASPSLITAGKIRRRRLSVTFSDEIHYSEPEAQDKSTTIVDDNGRKIYEFFPPPLATAHHSINSPPPSLKGLGIDTTNRPSLPERIKSDDEVVRKVNSPETALARKQHPAVRPEALVLGVLWMIYVSWMAQIQGALSSPW